MIPNDAPDGKYYYISSTLNPVLGDCPKGCLQCAVKDIYI